MGVSGVRSRPGQATGRGISLYVDPGHRRGKWNYPRRKTMARSSRLGGEAGHITIYPEGPSADAATPAVWKCMRPQLLW